VSLQLRLPGVNEYTGVTCVACEGLNLHLILVADIVTKLNLVRNELSSASVDSKMQDMVAVDVTNVTVNAAVAAADGVMMTDQQDDVNDLYDSADDVNRLINDGSDVATQSSRTANSQQLIKEQHEDKSLANCWSLAKRDKAGYFVRDGILYRKDRMIGQEFEQLCLPKARRQRPLSWHIKWVEDT